MSFVDQFAPVEFGSNTCDHKWYNMYGGYIIETKWNSKTKQYETYRHSYNMPNLNLMPDN